MAEPDGARGFYRKSRGITKKILVLGLITHLTLEAPMTLKDFLDKIMVVYVCPARVSDHLILGENYFNSKNV